LLFVVGLRYDGTREHRSLAALAPAEGTVALANTYQFGPRRTLFGRSSVHLSESGRSVR
jgi:hypothetical protein